MVDAAAGMAVSQAPAPSLPLAGRLKAGRAWPVCRGAELGDPRFRETATTYVAACEAPLPCAGLQHPAAQGWQRRWWAQLSVAVQQAVGSTALGRAWRVLRDKLQTASGVALESLETMLLEGGARAGT